MGGKQYAMQQCVMIIMLTQKVSGVVFAVSNHTNKSNLQTESGNTEG